MITFFDEFEIEVQGMNEEECIKVYRFLLNEEREWWCSMMENQVNFDPIINSIIKLQSIVEKYTRLNNHREFLELCRLEDNAKHKYNWDFSENKFDTALENNAYESSTVLENRYGSWINNELEKVEDR